MKTINSILIPMLVLCSVVYADGLMRPSDKSYPGNFLRHRMTKVDVVVTGQIAQTTVYQEFINEWTKSTDVVYSFPLPVDARATALYFWSNDTMYRAVLKVKEQGVNPGTGEGGIDAQVNAYLGANALRMVIPGVPAGKIQRVQLEYISLCHYANGRAEYRYPMNTTDFVLYPVELFSFNVTVNSQQAVTASSITPVSGAVTKQADANHLQTTWERSKIYLTTDILFSYTAKNDSLTTDFYAVDHDTMDGHFVILLRSPDGGSGNDVFSKNVVFILDRSADMFGATIADARNAIGECIWKLDTSDSFNIISFDFSVAKWRPTMSKATGTAKDSAVKYLSSLSYQSGNQMQSSLLASIDMLPANAAQNLIVLFSDGKNATDPVGIRNYNSKKVSIMTICGAGAAGRQRLEMISYLNYGIPASIAPNENMKDRVVQIFDRINHPVMKDVHYEVGSNVHSILPVSHPSLYKGSLTFFTGRYKNPGNSIFSVAGFSLFGVTTKDIPLTFPSDRSKNKFTESFWAKEKIDEIERHIAVFGENDSLKKADIALSLGYGIRCKYTSYNAEKTNPVVISAVDEASVTFLSADIFPRTDGTLLRWTLSSHSAAKEIRIYRKKNAGSVPELVTVVNGSVTQWLDSEHSSSETIYRIEGVSRSGAVSMVEVSVAGIVPTNFVLYPNFPNPFNPSTTIRFDLPVRQNVSLTVYDITGREIARLVEGYKEAGSHSVPFSGTNLTSGVYFCTLRAGNAVHIRKMTILK